MTNSNADRVGWWELTALASHVHPSVAAMAGTLLSGVNIVYNGNPLNDLSLSAFLDKFQEKKAKQNTWHGASQIEPAKKIEMNHQLIGPEILSLAEDDVPPEDVVFHKFYMNKMTSTKKLKRKKKKTPEDEAAEELYSVDGDGDGDLSDGDGSDSEEIDDVLDSANASLEADGDYDYDDLDKVADDDDDDLIGEASDDEIDVPSDDDEENMDDEAGPTEDGDDDVAIGEADDDDEVDFEDGFAQRKKKRKSGRGSGASPFASLEDYAHLVEGDASPEPQASPEKKRHKSKKNRKKRKLN